MDTRTYRAFTMAQALAAVRRDLGTDAVVLTTRSFKRGGFLGIGRRTIIEVTATRNTGQKKAATGSKPVGRARPSMQAVRQSQAQQAYQAKARAAVGVADTDARRQQLAVELLDELQRREQVAQLQKQPTTGATTREPAPAARSKPEAPAAQPGIAVTAPKRAAVPAQQAASAKTRQDPSTAPEPPAEPVARRFVLANGTGASAPRQSASRSAIRPTRAVVPRSVRPADDPPSTDSRAAAATDDAMQRELAAIRSMVGRVLQSTTASPQPAADIPQELFDAYLHLISQDLAEDIADEVIADVRATLTEADLSDTQRVRAAVSEQLAQHIPVADCPVAMESPDDRPLVIALVGPTGVGKTTTLAKLAASFKLRHERRVGLITCDTYRIAAVDQLRTYANIIGLPLEVVLTPAEMPRAMHALRDCDVILIDTAGRSQRDTDRLMELRQFLEQASPHEVHLVLSSTASEKVLMQEAAAFSSVGVDKVVLTKLDEAVSFGMLVNVIRKIGRELSFFTTGQEVPDHIEIGRADRLAALMLAAE